MTSPTQRKPSGYAAWHPEFGYLRSSLADRRELVEYESCTKADQEELGWQIRKVYLLTAEELEEERREAQEQALKAVEARILEAMSYTRASGAEENLVHEFRLNVRDVLKQISAKRGEGSDKLADLRRAHGLSKEMK